MDTKARSLEAMPHPKMIQPKLHAGQEFRKTCNTPRWWINTPSLPTTTAAPSHGLFNLKATIQSRSKHAPSFIFLNRLQIHPQLPAQTPHLNLRHQATQLNARSQQVRSDQIVSLRLSTTPDRRKTCQPSCRAPSCAHRAGKRGPKPCTRLTAQQPMSNLHLGGPALLPLRCPVSE